ncbi:MAG: hypothetical protein SF187_23085 [Deltaproteobacteria bacterium]|nr:hypothetical protein [Deltaproteobacteria bacterium]
MNFTKRTALLLRANVVVAVSLWLCLWQPQAIRAQTWVNAHDPKSFVSPPLGAKADGFGGQVRVDAELHAAWLRAQSQGPRKAATDTSGIVRVGEVLIVPGDDQMITMVGNKFGIAPAALKNITRPVIEFAGDNFEIITLWVTFDDRGTDALAYAVNVRNEVKGLGRRLPLQDMSGSYGSKGTLRAVVNMKGVGLSSTDEQKNWTVGLQIWGQETGHRFMAFMEVRDPRSGRPSDLLLGRDCAHFDWFVDTQASVQDGLAWTDNGNGTFTWTDRTLRYGNLDLYGMGLMPGDELPPFFAITDVANYTRPACLDWSGGRIPTQQTVTGKRLDLGIDDVVAANGLRVPEMSTGYMRELQVVVTKPNESVTSATAVGLAQRIDRARVWWEEWARTASGNRLVVCTQSTADCGDARSDVLGVAPAPNAVPALGPVPFEVNLANTGAKDATGIKASVEVRLGEQRFSSGPPQPVPALPAGAVRTERISVSLPGVACGTEVEVFARTQSDFHYSRQRVSLPVGVSTLWTEGFEQESGWVVNADATDTGQGATWERGRPQLSFLSDRTVQPDAAFAGDNAFVTGLVPTESGLSGGFVKMGKVSLLSPVVPAAGARTPTLRYHVSFSGMRSAGGGGVEASDQSSLVVQVRSVAAGVASPWVDIDRLTNLFTSGWIQRVVVLPMGLNLSEGVQFQFVAADDNVDAPGGVEAAIDDVSLTSTLAACDVPDAGVDGGRATDDGGGCGCTVGRRSPRDAAFVFVCGALWLWRRRRR